MVTRRNILIHLRLQEIIISNPFVRKEVFCLCLPVCSYLIISISGVEQATARQPSIRRQSTATDDVMEQRRQWKQPIWR